MKIKKHITGFINIHLFLLCTALTVLSCTNFSSSDSGSRYSGKKIKFTGSIVMEDTSGAVPEEIQNLFVSGGSDSSERSATVEPFVYDTTKHYYYAEATLRGKGTKVTDVTWDDSHTTFSMELPDYGTWDVEVGIKYSTENKIIYSSKEPVEIIQGGPTSYSKNFIAKPSQSDDKNGKINLEISTATNSGINFVQINLLNGNSTNWNTLFSGTNCILPVSSNKITIGGSGKNLPSGNYTVQIDFYDYNSFNANDLPSAAAAVSTGGAVLVYSTIQTINIYDDLITNRWVSVNSDANNPIDSSGKFTITQNILNSYTLTNICVASNGSDSNFGTVYNPYKTLNKAISYINERGSSSNDFTISVSGDVECNTEISLATSKAKTLTIKGKSGSNANDKLNGKSNGRVLKLNTGITVTIENLTITGGDAKTGSDDDKSGGGIYLANGTLKLGDGAKISGNHAAAFGGGVYVASGTKLFMYGSSLIGDTIQATATSSTLTSSGTTGCANAAVGGGGGLYNNGGEVYIGYNGLSGDTPQKSDMTSGYGVRRNYSERTYGGGICNRKGTLIIASGSVSYNQCVGGNGTAGAGGGIFNAYESTPATSLTIEAPANTSNKFVMYGNKAVRGGAICNNTYGVITIKAGQIGGSASNLQNTATENGGAVYHGGKTLSVSGTALIYTGSEKTNDVYLPSGTYVTAGSIGTNGNSSSNKMPLTPEEYKREIKLVQADGVTVNEDLWNKFELTQDDGDWAKIKKTENAGSSNEKNYVAITAPVYVAGASETTVSGVTYKKGLSMEEGALGTKSKPFKFISDAVGVFEDSSSPAVVTIVGTTYPVAQEIPDTFTTSKATALTLKGLSSSSVGTIKRYTTVPSSTASDGSALTVNSAVPVTIQDITITGGKTSGYGGGINIAATGAKVTLSDGTVVKGNYAGGSGTGGGGGVYNAGALYMAGTAVIGDASQSNIAEYTNAAYSNYSIKGGGIYNAATGTVTLGATLTEDKELTGGIYYNYASGMGAGIYNIGGNIVIKSGTFALNRSGSGSAGGGAGLSSEKSDNSHLGSVIMSGGCIRDNKVYASSGDTIMGNGGGVCISSGTFKMSGGSVERNEAGQYGGGFYLMNDATLFVSGSAWIGNKNATSPAQDSSHCSNKARCGGGIMTNTGKLYLGYDGFKSDGTTPNPAASFTGGVSYNYASLQGGGLSCGITYMCAGTIKCNTAGSVGGASYLRGTLYISGSAEIPYGGAEKKNDVRVEPSCKINVAGTLTKTTVATITPANWKRGGNNCVIAASGDVTLDSDLLSHFNVSDSEWGVYPYAWSATLTLGALDSPKIYVGSATPVSGSGVSAPDGSTDNHYGTKAFPCASIEEAVGMCWNSSTDYKIIVSGELKDVAQSLPSSLTTAKAKTVALMGKTGNAKDIINRNLSATPTSGSGTALTVDTTVPVTITGLTIKKGYADGSNAADKNGGGIKVNAGAKVTLGSGAVVADNYAKSNGGGVYVNGSGAQLTVETGATIGKSSSTSANSKDNSSNYASSSGAGIYVDGGASASVTGGTISYNYANSYGGGICVVDGNATINGDVTLSQNGATGGGCLYIQPASGKNAKITLTKGTVQNCYVKNSGNSSIQVYGRGVLELGAKAYVPYSASDTSNFVFLGTEYSNSTYYSGSINVTAVPANGKHSSSNKLRVFVAGTTVDIASKPIITTNNSTVLTGASGWLKCIELKNANPPTDYASHEVTTDSAVDSTLKNAYYRKWRGLKNPTTAKAVGDIVFNDGSASAYSNSLSLTNNQKSAAIAVIFYASSSSSAALGARTLGIGMKWVTTDTNNYGIPWCTSTASAYNEVAVINATNSPGCTYSGTQPNYTFTGDKNGSDNLNQIAIALKNAGKVNDTGVEGSTKTAAQAALLYPAFYWAINYSTNSGLTLGSYTSGWYLPCLAELYQVYKSKAMVNGAMELCGYTKLEESIDYGDGTGCWVKFWSSTPSDAEIRDGIAYYYFASTFDFLDTTRGGCGGYAKDPEYSCGYCSAIREF